jgi:hypothetical protein
VPKSPAAGLAERAPRSNRSTITSALAGFVCGAVTWHAVGFWDFMRQVAFNDDTAVTVAEAAVQPGVRRDGPLPSAIPPSALVTGSIHPRSRTVTLPCVALVRDRERGTTELAPCPHDTAPLRDAGRRQRADRAADFNERLANPNAWASATATAVEVELADNDDLAGSRRNARQIGARDDLLTITVPD